MIEDPARSFYADSDTGLSLRGQQLIHILLPHRRASDDYEP